VNSRFVARFFCHNKTFVAVAHLRKTFPSLSTKEGNGLFYFHFITIILDDGVLKFINLIEQLKTVAESSYSNAMSCNIITSLSDIFNITKIKFEKFEKGIYKLRNVFS